MTHATSRRAFLRRAASLSLAGVATPWALNLAALGEAAAADATDYKALVCVFLAGGNDNANTVVPWHDEAYAAYQRMRPTMAHPRSALAATALSPAVPLTGGEQYALAPQLVPLLPFFDQGQLAVLLNVGALARPTTKAQYLARAVPVPPKLFSHNDQQSVWQASAPEGARTGWGGRMGDLFAAGNGSATFTCMSVAGNAVFLNGDTAAQYQVTSAGPVALTGARSLFGSSACAEALLALSTAPQSHGMAQAHARIMARALQAGDTLGQALAGAPAFASFPANNGLASQLKLVARTVASANTLGARRQVFFVSLGGFDTHLGLAGTHGTLMGRVAEAIVAFQAALTEIGMADKVTTFTASEFGRTITGADGSDHGWGAEHFVLGGAVRGGRLYGQPPVIANNGPDDIGQGRMVPTTSVEQLGATLGRWFGVSDSALLDLFPNLAYWNESQRNLGFL